MQHLFSTQTYQIKFTYQSVLLRGLLAFLGIIIGLALIIEIIARLFFIPFSFPSLGSDNFYFDYKVYALESHMRQVENLDCLVLGSSVANSDLDPEIIANAYRDKTGKQIHCFNIGIPALTAENAIPIADAIIQRYQPKVILFILIPRDLMDHEFTVEQLEHNLWVNYHRGQGSPESWLIVNSYSLRYFTTSQYWQTLANREKMTYETDPISPYGYSRITGQNQPYPRDWLLENDKSLEGVWEQGKTYTILHKLTSLKTDKTKFVFIEAPAYTIINMDRDDPAIQHYENDYIANLQSYLDGQNIPFWRTLEIGEEIPKPGWFDWLHLNTQGSPILSQWIGERLAENPDFFE